MDMDGGAKGWLVNYARANYWRVSTWYELDDLVQDGLLTYTRIVQRYGHVKDRRHIMGLFKRAYVNHIHDLAKKKTRTSPEIRESDLGAPIDQTSASLYATPDTSPVLATLPPIVRKAIVAIQTSPELREAYRRNANGTRETTHERLCRVLGVSPEAIPPILQYLHSTLAPA